MKWRKTLTLTEAAFMVVGLNPEKDFGGNLADIKASFSEAVKPFDQKMSKIAISDIDDYMKLLDSIDRIPKKLANEQKITFNKLTNYRKIFLALIIDAKLCGNHDKYNAKTVLHEVFHGTYIGHVDKETEKGAMPQYTRESLAQWFYETGDLAKAIILWPTFISETQDKSVIIFDLKEQNKKLLADNNNLKRQLSEIDQNITKNLKNYPSGIQNSISVFEECWEHLTYDMKRPSLDELLEFMSTKFGKQKDTYFKALLKLTTPDNDYYGGTPKREHINPWKQKNKINF